MVDDVILNPIDQDGVPLYGPFADYVNGAVQLVSRQELDRLRLEGRFDPKATKERMRKAKLDAIAQWIVDHPDQVIQPPTLP